MRAIVVIWILGILAAVPVGAQDAQEGALATESTATVRPTEEEVSSRALGLFTRLMSPYCPGATLRDCGSGQAGVLRDRVRQWIREGQSDQQITDTLVEEFGETILGKPKFKGFGTVAYIAPVAALLIGLFALVAYLRRQRKSVTVSVADGPQHPSKATDDRALRERLEEELRMHGGR